MSFADSVKEVRQMREDATAAREHREKIDALCGIIVKAYQAGFTAGSRGTEQCGGGDAAQQCVSIVVEALEAAGIASESEILEVVRGRL